MHEKTCFLPKLRILNYARWFWNINQSINNNNNNNNNYKYVSCSYYFLATYSTNVTYSVKCWLATWHPPSCYFWLLDRKPWSTWPSLGSRTACMSTTPYTCLGVLYLCRISQARLSGCRGSLWEDPCNSWSRQTLWKAKWTASVLRLSSLSLFALKCGMLKSHSHPSKLWGTLFCWWPFCFTYERCKWVYIIPFHRLCSDLVLIFYGKVHQTGELENLIIYIL